MEIFKTNKKQSATVIRDFDALVIEPVAFKLHGKIHTLKPISVEELWKFAHAMQAVQSATEKNEISVDGIKGAYLAIFQSVCPSIQMEDVDQMNQAQIGALLQFVIDTIKGASQVDDYEIEKKKSLPG